jgi:hypothetical protein
MNELRHSRELILLLYGLWVKAERWRGGRQGGKIKRAALNCRPDQPEAFELLFRIHEMAAPVLLPALFIVFGAERLFFTVADCLDAVG